MRGACLINRCRPTLLLAGLLVGAGLGCRTPPPLPPQNLSLPGWVAREGQAVWKPSRSRAEVVGDLLVATNANGDAVLQLTKTPFTMVHAQTVGGQWQIEFGGGQRRFAGRGSVPARFGWLQLPRALAGAEPAPGWIFTRSFPKSWRLENRSTGEVLEGAFFP